jgi:hypothetical protein
MLPERPLPLLEAAHRRRAVEDAEGAKVEDHL